jgi:hypothetical protein
MLMLMLAGSKGILVKLLSRAELQFQAYSKHNPNSIGHLFLSHPIIYKPSKSSERSPQHFTEAPDTVQHLCRVDSLPEHHLPALALAPIPAAQHPPHGHDVWYQTAFNTKPFNNHHDLSLIRPSSTRSISTTSPPTTPYLPYIGLSSTRGAWAIKSRMWAFSIPGQP